MTRGNRILSARAVVVTVAALAVGVAFTTGDDGGSPSSGSGNEPIVLEFPYSPDTQELLEPLIEEFNDAGFRQGGRPIVVEGEDLSSGRAERAISEERLRPVLWGPASSLWGRLLNHDVGESWAADENPSLVESPQVIAMWEPQARALGWPDSPVGWNDILALATDPDGWASRGRPQDGAFKLGHTNPNSSTSGLSAVAAMYYAVAGDYTAADVERPGVRTAVHEIEQSIVHYVETAEDFLAQMTRYGPDYAHAVAVQEYQLVQFNEETDGSKLVAVYPAEGTLVADYPLIVLRAPWVDEDERGAAETFQRWLVPRITPELAARFGYRAPDAPVVLPPVDKAHGADPAEPQPVLEPPTPDVIATIQANWNEDRKPSNVMLVVDTSGSIGQAGLLDEEQAALEAFLGELEVRPNDRVGLVTFGSEAFEVVPPVELGEGKTELRQAIRDLVPSGKSALYDAVQKGFAQIRGLEDQTRINAVVVVTDGRDDSSETTLDALVRELTATCDSEGVAIPVVTVAYGPDADRKALARIAGACQGGAVTANRDDIADVFAGIGLFF